MYPYNLIKGIQFNLYDLFLCIGIIVCLISFDRLADKYPLRYKLQNFVFITAAAAIAVGLGSAVLFQAFYNFGETGEFVINASTGATFYGGLIGGAASFIAIYFIVGYFVFPDKYHIRSFFSVANCAVPSILVAHACGRLGCLMAGCCHGAQTDAWYGIYMHTETYGYAKCVPTQLYEALFLFALFAYTVIRIKKKQSYNLPIYMAAYGAWRFFIEYFRTDDRGELITDAFSPSQIIAFIMIAGGIALVFFQRYYERRHRDEILADANEILARRAKKEEVKNAGQE